jgi:hypothetical protein
MQIGRNYHMKFDTHKYIKTLMRQGMEEPQAESIVQIVSDSREFDLSRLATKDQLEIVKVQVEDVKERVGNLEGRVESLEERVIKFEDRVDGRFARLEQKVDVNLRWMIGLMVTVLGMLIHITMKIH